MTTQHEDEIHIFVIGPKISSVLNKNKLIFLQISVNNGLLQSSNSISISIIYV